MVARHPYKNLTGNSHGFYFHCKDGHDSRSYHSEQIAHREGLRYAHRIDAWTKNELWEGYANSPREFFEVRQVV